DVPSRFPVMPERVPVLNGEDAALAFAEVLLEQATPWWFIGWRDITRATDLRTLIAGLVPRAGIGDKFLLIEASVGTREVLALYACLNSLVCDYLARQKVGGTSFKYFTMRQIAVPSPSLFTSRDLDFLCPRTLEL